MELVNKEPTTFTIEELHTLSAILNSPGRPAGIKDLRVIDSVDTYITKAIPQPPTQPEQLKPDATDEEKVAHHALMETFQKEAQAYQTQEVPLSLSNTQEGIIKNRLSNFPNFNTDTRSRKAIIALADKLNIQ